MFFSKKLKAAGELVSAEGLAWPTEAKIIHAASDGSPIIESGFSADRQFLIGFWIVETATAERAYAIAAEASAAPGKGGVPLNMPIEVRQIMSGPPDSV